MQHATNAGWCKQVDQIIQKQHRQKEKYIQFIKAPATIEICLTKFHHDRKVQFLIREEGGGILL